MKLVQMDEDLCQKHYSHLADKPFFPKIVGYMTNGPVVAAVLEGIDAVRQVRNICGATDPQFAAPGTIRGDHSCVIDFNLIHASDSVRTAIEEVARFFDEKKEVYDYTKGLYV